jgi:hypothetical protein
VVPPPELGVRQLKHPLADSDLEASLHQPEIGIEYTAHLGQGLQAIREWLDLLVVHPELHGGESCIKATRISVSVIVGGNAYGDLAVTMGLEYL